MDGQIAGFGQRNRRRRLETAFSPPYALPRLLCAGIIPRSLIRGRLPDPERWPSGRRRAPAKGVWVKSPSRVRIPPSPPSCELRRDFAQYAPVAQLDRAPGYEPGGREFESLRAHHCFPCPRTLTSAPTDRRCNSNSRQTNKTSSTTRPPFGRVGRCRAARRRSGAQRQDEGPQAPKQSLRAHHCFPCPRTLRRHRQIGVVIRTPGRQTRRVRQLGRLSAELDAAAQRRRSGAQRRTRGRRPRSNLSGRTKSRGYRSRRPEVRIKVTTRGQTSVVDRQWIRIQSPWACRRFCSCRCSSSRMR